jgi:hypothetical protein
MGKVARWEYQVIQNVRKEYPGLCHSQQNLVRLWMDPKVNRAADEELPCTAERLLGLLRNNYLDVTNLLQVVEAQNMTLIEIGYHRIIFFKSSDSTP